MKIGETEKNVVGIRCYLPRVYTFGGDAEIIEKSREMLLKMQFMTQMFIILYFQEITVNFLQRFQ